MTQKYTLEATQYGEFVTPYGKKLVATVRGSSIQNKVKGELPLDANIRRPTKNKVVRGILERLESFSGTYTLGGQINIVCRSFRVLAKENSSGFSVEIVFEDGDGVIDGGHRLYALKLANLDRGTYATENVFVELCIESGLSIEQIRQKAITENTSKSPDSFSIAYHKGTYQWFENLLSDSIYKHVRFYEGQAGTSISPHCAAKNLIMLPVMVSKVYDPLDRKNLTDPGKRHPVFISQAYITSRNMDFALSAYAADTKKQKNILDLLEIYCDICKAIDSTHKKKPVPFVRDGLSVRNLTHLPDGTILSCQIPARFYTFLIVSMFRVALDERGEWKIPLHYFKSRFIASCLSTTVKVIRRKYPSIMAGSLQVNPLLWDEIYNKAIEIFSQIEAQYKQSIAA